MRLRTESSLKHLRRYNTTPVDLRIGEMTRGRSVERQLGRVYVIGRFVWIRVAMHVTIGRHDHLAPHIRRFERWLCPCLGALKLLMELNGWIGVRAPFPSTIDWPRIVTTLAKKGWTCEAGVTMAG